MHYFVNKEKCCQICTCSVSFYFTLLDCVHFYTRLKSANYKSQWNILVFYDQWKITSDLNMSQGKMYDLVSVPLLGFISVIKLRKFDFESHWNILIFFDKKRDISDLNMSHGKMSDFISFPLFGFTLAIKLRNFNFNGHQSYFNVSW